MSAFVLGNVVVGSSVGRPRSSFCSRVQQRSNCRSVRMTVAPPAVVSDATVDEHWRLGQEGMWRGQKVHYCSLNEDAEGVPLVLVHGFGASAEHWRFNAEELSSAVGSRPVYAIDLLGFGRSEKPTLPDGFDNYGVSVWGTQIGEFIETVVQRPAIIAGNSLGGYSTLWTAAKFPDAVKGLVLVNMAGPTKTDLETVMKKKSPSVFTRWASYFGFLLLRRPQRVRSILNTVYTDDKKNVDDDLVDFILNAAFTPGAFEVFFRSTLGVTPGPSIEELTSEIKETTPVAAIWGENDPWCTKAIALRIKDIFPRLELGFLEAGHCPHDEKPEEFNVAFEDFLQRHNI